MTVDFVENKHPMGCESQLAQTCRCTPTFWPAILTHKVSHAGLVLVWDEGSLVDVYMQDYKSLCAAVKICATLIKIQTDTHTDTQRGRQHFDQLT